MLRQPGTLTSGSHLTAGQLRHFSAKPCGPQSSRVGTTSRAAIRQLAVDRNGGHRADAQSLSAAGHAARSTSSTVSSHARQPALKTPIVRSVLMSYTSFLCIRSALEKALYQYAAKFVRFIYGKNNCSPVCRKPLACRFSGTDEMHLIAECPSNAAAGF